MSCSSHTIPYKKWRLQVLSDLFLPQVQTQPRRSNTRRHLSLIKTLRNVRAYSTSNDNSDRNQGSPYSEKITNTPLNTKRPSDALPKSPLFKLAQTHQTGHRPRKPQGTKADDARLRDNPWAVALASPLRFCAGTAMRVPKAFLTDMSLVRRIDESAEGKERKTSLWWMPSGLLKDKLSVGLASSGSKPPVMRLLTRALLVEYLPDAVRRGSYRKVQAFQLVPTEWRTALKRSEYVELTEMDWPEGLSDLILKHLGQKVVKSLKEAYRYEQIKRATADQWRVLQLSSDLSISSLIEGLRHVEMKDMATGAVVILGDSGLDMTKGDPFASQFPDYLTLPQTQSMVPVFDLSTLLSVSDRQELRAAIPRFGEKALFFRADGPKSVDAMLALWELKGYVMHDTDYVPEMRDRTSVDKE